MSVDLQLGGLRALVTGGTKGVGAAVVARLREDGVKVLTTARSLDDNLNLLGRAPGPGPAAGDD
jgi:NAD(P)-dependent dehydrogenase (short-subunit alcohol dehydrogenase family)